MKKILRYTLLVSLASAIGLLAGAAKPIAANQLVDHGLPPGAASAILPQNAFLQIQCNDLLATVETLERILTSGVPQKLLPPDAQQLLQSEHPVLTLLGMQTVQEPLTQESISRWTGLNARAQLSLTLYPGDPRRLFILALPMSQRDALAGSLTSWLEPTEVEEITVDGRTVLRVAPTRPKIWPELFVVCSPDVAFLCGDRALALALHSTPSAQRLAVDPFLGRVLPEVKDKAVCAIVNPAVLKPFALQLQQVQSMVLPMILQQRHLLLAQMPPHAREGLEIQLRTRLGVDDLDQFGNYAEAILIATVEQLTDFITNRLMAFEGFYLAAHLRDPFPELNLKIFSQDIQPASSTAPIPMDQVRQAMTWLGHEFHSFRVAGRQPVKPPSPILSEWVKRARAQFDTRGLESPAFDRLAAMLEDEVAVATIESQVPWTLTTYAPLYPQPSLRNAESLSDYFDDLDLPARRPVQLIPGQRREFLERTFRLETDARNRNRELKADFLRPFRSGTPWIQTVNRFETDQTDPGISRYSVEHAFVTRSGLFGFDQHELVSRRIYYARELGRYLVFHRGVRSSPWLGEFRGSANQPMSPGLVKLLDRLPEDVNHFEVDRVLVRLPDLVHWLSALEDRVHADTHRYLARAQQILDETADREEAIRKLKRLPFPEAVAALNLDPASQKVYCLLPGGIPFPRPKLAPVLERVTQDFAARADSVGGSLCYTRVRPETYEVTLSQSTEALTTLVSTVGNSLFDHYLGSTQGQEELGRTTWTPRDGDRKRFDEVLVSNPWWAFVQMPHPRKDAKPLSEIPARAPDAPAALIDLTAHYNAALDQTWHVGGVANNSLVNLPRGLQEFGGTRFDVRGIVQLSGRELESALSVKYPEQVTGIVIEQTAERIHFLHAAAWQSDPGTKIGAYVVHYANGEQREIPIVYGQEVSDWWYNQPQGPDSRLTAVWTGSNTANGQGQQVSLYKTTWVNPLPDVKIVSLEFRSTVAASGPFLVAITLE